MGSAAHTTLLEFDQFSNRYLVMPKVDCRTKLGKEQKALAEQQAESENKILLDQAEWTSILNWREKILDDPIVSDLFAKNLGENEISGFFKHPIVDINGCFRCDKLLKKEKLCVDLKFMQSAHPFAFASAVKKYRYDIQASWYIDGLKTITGNDYDFLFVVCEKVRPWNVQTYRLDAESLERGRDDTRHFIRRFKEYRSASDSEKKRLSGYYNGIQTLNIKWY